VTADGQRSMATHLGRQASSAGDGAGSRHRRARVAYLEGYLLRRPRWGRTVESTLTSSSWPEPSSSQPGPTRSCLPAASDRDLLSSGWLISCSATRPRCWSSPELRPAGWPDRAGLSRPGGRDDARSRGGSCRCWAETANVPAYPAERVDTTGPATCSPPVVCTPDPRAPPERPSRWALPPPKSSAISGRGRRVVERRPARKLPTAAH